MIEKTHGWHATNVALDIVGPCKIMNVQSSLIVYESSHRARESDNDVIVDIH